MKNLEIDFDHGRAKNNGFMLGGVAKKYYDDKDALNFNFEIQSARYKVEDEKSGFLSWICIMIVAVLLFGCICSISVNKIGIYPCIYQLINLIMCLPAIVCCITLIEALFKKEFRQWHAVEHKTFNLFEKYREEPYLILKA